MNLLPLPIQRFYDNNNVPLVAGQVFTYIAGTSTPQATFTDSTGITQNTNPVVLNARGEGAIWIDPAKAYKIVLQDALGNQIWVQDNVTAGVSITAQLGIYGTDSGVVNAYVVTHVGLTSISLSAGTLLRFTPLNTNTGPVTVNADSTGVVAVVRANGSPCTGGELSSTGPVVLQYNGTAWQIVASTGIQPGIANLLSYGADPAGIADSRGALNTASTVNMPFTIPPGTYLVNSNVTIAPNVVFQPGAILKPAAGVTITLSSSFQADRYQIFDQSLGGLVVMPTGAGEVWANWWGAKGDLVKTNNEVAFNQAWFALLDNSNGISYGGTINIDRGDYLKSGSSYHSDNISYQGHGGGSYPLIKANTATWSGNNMFLSQSAIPVRFTVSPLTGATSATFTVPYSGITDAAVSIVFFAADSSQCEIHTASVTNNNTAVSWTGGLAKNCTFYASVLTKNAIFDNKIINLRIDANNIAAITQVIYAPAWQQQSGLEGCLINNVVNWGVFLEFGYGGAAQLTFRRNIITASNACISGSAGVKIGGTNGLGGTTGRFKLNLEENQFTSNPATVTFANPIANSLTFTGAPGSGATSATLNGNWGGTTGAYLVWFVETAGGANELRSVTLTNGQTTATWTGGLGANCNATTSAAPSTPLSGALASNWTFATGVWNVLFSDTEARNVTLTNGATTVTWSTNLVNPVTATANATSPNTQGILSSNSRVTINCQNLHFEGCHDCFNLDGNACVVGDGIATDGTTTCTNVFTLQTTWTGSIGAQNVFKCGAINYVNDLARAGAPTSEPTNNFLMWPPVTGSPSWMPQVSYDATNGGWTINAINSAGGFTATAGANANLYTTMKGVSNNSVGTLWYINNVLYGRWGVDSGGNLVTGSSTGDSFVRTVNTRMLFSLDDGASIHVTMTGAANIHSHQHRDSGTTRFNTGWLETPVNNQATPYTAVLSDSGKLLYYNGTGAATFTIPANASVAYPVGTELTFINDATGATNMTIAITSDTMALSPGGTTGSRTLAQFGRAKAVKVATTRWVISGSGLT